MAPAPGGGHTASSELVCSRFDLLKDAAEVLGDVVVPKSKLGHTAGAQPRTSPLVSALVLTLAMLAAVELDRKVQCWAVEIEHILAGGMLPAEA